jgi:tRNA pseudouridine38-40 synthase
MNVKLTVEYDGTDYHGWQIQRNEITIQEALEAALRTLLGQSARVSGSGRTDAGVHALGQVANFVFPGELDLARIQKGLNALVRPSIVISKAEAADDAFDARRDARSRVYQYRVWNSRWPSAFHRHYSWHIPRRLDVDTMEEAARLLEGEIDFSSFQAAGCDASHPVRRAYRSRVSGAGDFVFYDIEATAFLRHMVRNIVGTLALVGRGELSPQGFAEIVQVRDRTRAGPTAPAQGLFLVDVKY